MSLGVSEREEYSQEYVDWIKRIAADLDTSDEQGVVTASLTLVELAFRQGVPSSLGRQLVDSLLAKLTQNAVIARSAAWALFWLSGGNGQGRQDLVLAHAISDHEIVLKVLNSDVLDSTVAVFLLAIRQQGNSNRGDSNDELGEQIGPRLLSSLESPEVATRGNAVFALDMIRYEGAVDAYINRFRDDDAYVRKAAIHALGNLASRKVKLSEHQMAEIIPSLIERMQDGSAEVVQAADNALRELLNKEQAVGLLPMLKHEKQTIRHRATQLLLRLDCEEMINSFAPEALAEYNVEDFSKPTR
jgi:HEAT repeat protein